MKQCRTAVCSYLREGDEGQRGHRSEHDSRDQHDQRYQGVITEEGDGGQPTAETDTIVLE